MCDGGVQAREGQRSVLAEAAGHPDPQGDEDQVAHEADQDEYTSTAAQQEYYDDLVFLVQVKLHFDANPEPVIARYQHPAWGEIELFTYTSAGGQTSTLMAWQGRYWVWTDIVSLGGNVYSVTVPEIMWYSSFDRKLIVTTDAQGIDTVTLVTGEVPPQVPIFSTFTRVE